jgi:hypothetical protein
MERAVRLVICVGLIAACVSFAALAQSPEDAPSSGSTPSAEPFHARFERRPDARQRRYFPAEAMYREITGSALVCCVPRPDRTVSCSVAVEIPEGRGFGDAARAIVEDNQQLTIDSYAEYLAAQPGAIPVPMRFRIEDAEAPALPANGQALCNSPPAQ